MSASDEPDPLPAALDQLSALCDEADRAAVAGLLGRLREGRLRVLVAGEAKRGKSTLINALLGRPVLPAGVIPLTALATTVRYGREERVTAVYRDGHSDGYPLAALNDLVTERGNPGNCRGLASVTVSVDSPVLARGVELVDTPGTGSVYAHNTAEAEAAQQTMDAAVLVLSADPPISASERELMGRIASLSVALFVVLNKADYLAGAGAGSELAEALEFAESVTGEVAGRPVRIYPLSARSALASGDDPGFAEFARDFTAYLNSGRATDLRLAVAAHGRRLAWALRDEAGLARRAAQMRSGDAAQRVEAFNDRLTVVSRRRQEAADLVAAEAARMLADLNESAGQGMREAARVGAEMEALMIGDLRSASAAETERIGGARLAELAVAAAEDWRRQQAERLEEGLARLDERLTAELRAELDALREAAAALLGLSLAVRGPGGRLAPDLRFFYLTAPAAGQTELLAGAVRRRLPGEAGRRRARAYLRRQAADLVPQQIGRARADLQYRLAEATRLLSRAVGDRYRHSTGRLENALLTASVLRQASEEEAAGLEQELVQRQQALAGVLALLDHATTTIAAARSGRSRAAAPFPDSSSP